MAWGSGGWGEAGWGRGVTTDAVVERAGAKDVPSAAVNAAVVVVEHAAANDIPVKVGGVTTFTLVERAAINDRLLLIQFGAVDIRERVTIHDNLIGLPLFLGAIVEKAGAHEVLGSPSGLWPVTYPARRCRQPSVLSRAPRRMMQDQP
jgi:hypothetical protein